MGGNEKHSENKDSCTPKLMGKELRNIGSRAKTLAKHYNNTNTNVMQGQREQSRSIHGAIVHRISIGRKTTAMAIMMFMHKERGVLRHGMAMMP